MLQFNAEYGIALGGYLKLLLATHPRYLLDWCNDGKCDADPKIDDD